MNKILELKKAITKAEQDYRNAVEACMRDILHEAGFDDGVNVLQPAKHAGRKGMLCIRPSSFNGRPEVVFYPYTKSGALNKNSLYVHNVTSYDCERFAKQEIIDMLKYCYAPLPPAATEEVTFNA